MAAMQTVDEAGPAVAEAEPAPAGPACAPAPCRGCCEAEFDAAVIALEDEAARLGFRLAHISLIHTRCGKSRSSATEARRLTRELLRRRQELMQPT